MQPVQVLDQVPDERAARVELDRPRDVVGEPAEVGVAVAEEVDPGREQEQAAHGSLRRDQPQDDPAAVRVAGVPHSGGLVDHRDVGVVRVERA